MYRVHVAVFDSLSVTFWYLSGCVAREPIEL
jgi:hypothetical protein